MDGYTVRLCGRGQRVADRSTRGIGGFPGESAATDLPGSAQGRGRAKSVCYALASREQNREGGEGRAHAARLENRGYSDCAAQSADRYLYRPCIGPVQVPTGKHPPLHPLRSDVREAKTDAGHERAWLCGCGAAAWERRARARRGEAPASRGGAGG